jgi:CheY-like chemotaxis protein
LSEYVLVVEDDPSIREALSEALETEGYRVVCAEHGQAALQHLAGAEPPCLVLLDVMMPVMDGIAFRQAMLGDARLAEIPVVVITAGGAQLAARVPASKVLHKPVRMEVVVAAVREHCAGTADPAAR